MALLTCRECGKEVSDKAYTCPHCGYPLKEQEKTRYRLRIGHTGTSGFAVFLRVLAILCWAGGLIIAISGALVTVAGRSGSETRFEFGTFLTLYSTYVISGFLFMCLASVVNEIRSIYTMISGTSLEAEAGNAAVKNTGNSKPDYLQNFIRKTSSGGWKCSFCEAKNPAEAISCKECGRYR